MRRGWKWRVNRNERKLKHILLLTGPIPEMGEGGAGVAGKVLGNVCVSSLVYGTGTGNFWKVFRQRGGRNGTPRNASGEKEGMSDRTRAGSGCGEKSLKYQGRKRAVWEGGRNKSVKREGEN